MHSQIPVPVLHVLRPSQSKSLTQGLDGSNVVKEVVVIVVVVSVVVVALVVVSSSVVSIISFNVHKPEISQE